MAGNGLREVIELSGVWQYALHIDESRIEEEQGAWEEIEVPSNWHLGGLPNYAGTVYFRHTFTSPSIPPDKDVRLVFHGVDYFTTVWLNGTYLGNHEGYFQPFAFDVTHVLREENVLVVKVTSPKESPTLWPDDKWLIKGVFNHHDCRPGGWSKENGQDGNTGGIWNKVELVIASTTHIEDMQLAPTLLPTGSARIKVTARVISPTAQVLQGALRLTHNVGSTEVTVAGARRDIHLSPGLNEVVIIQTIQSPTLWWTWDQGEAPLYLVELTLSRGDDLLDRISERCGIRSFRIDEKGIWYLNNRRIFPRGTNFIPTQWLSEYSIDMIAEDIRLLKQANVNAIRVHAHVNRKELYEACDEAGILVWQDFALQWSYDDTDEFTENAAAQMREMIRQLYNHPSIVLWCCHNEPSKNRNTLDPVLFSVVAETDSTRHTMIASDFHDHSYPGWYYGSLLEFRETPCRPLVAEFGAQALPNAGFLRQILGEEELFPPNWRKWGYHNFQYHETFNVAKVEMGEILETFVENSQEYQAKLLQFAIENYRRAKYKSVTGLFQFMFVDCWPSISWSVLDYYRRPKKGYYALQQAYQPLLASIEMSQDIVLSGGEALFSLCIVNDLSEEFKEARWSLRVENPDGGVEFDTEGQTDIAPDEVTSLGDRFWPTCIWPIPSSARPGQYTVRARLWSAQGDMLSENTFRFAVVAKPPGTEELGKKTL